MFNTSTIPYTNHATTKHSPSDYHTFKVGSLVVYCDNENKKHLDIVLGIYDELEIRSLTDGIQDYTKFRHALLNDLIELSMPPIRIKSHPEYYKKPPEHFEQWSETYNKSVNNYLAKNTLVTKSFDTMEEIEQIIANEILISITQNPESNLIKDLIITYYTN